MLKCDGYKMFEGVAQVVFKNGRGTENIRGTWLFKPDVKMWFVGPTAGFPWGASFDEESVTVLEETA